MSIAGRGCLAGGVNSWVKFGASPGVTKECCGTSLPGGQDAFSALDPVF